MVLRAAHIAALQADRDEQLLPKLVAVAIERLRESGQLPPRGELPPTPEHEPGEPPPEDLDWSEPAIERRFQSGIRAAHALDVRSEAGVVQFLGYDLEFGSAWREHTRILAALNRPGASEDDRMSAVYHLIASL